MSIFTKAIEYLTGKKEEKVKELEQKVKNLEETTITNQQLINAIESIESQKQPCKNKVYYNVSTGNVTVVDCQGDTYAGVVEPDKVELLKSAELHEIIELLSPKEKVNNVKNNQDEQEKDLVSNFLDIFEGNDDFEVVGKSLYFKGIKSVEIPSLIVARFVELLEQHNKNCFKLSEFEEYQALKAFTLKLLLNPIQESREHCLTFVRNFDIKLTNTGNMIMYRRIVAKSNSNKELIEFVSKQYLKVKSWKKAPKDYFVHYNNTDYSLMKLKFENNTWEDVKHAFVGNLAELYQNLSELTENRYTDDYTKSYDIRIGSVYKIREEDIDINKNGSCGGALHVADGKKFNYSSFGNTPVCCLVSPQYVYKMDSGHSGKIGVKEMFIAAITSQDENGNYEDIDNQDLVNFDELYHNQNIQELEEALKTKSMQSVSVSTALSEVSLKDVENIKNLLNKRVMNI